MPPTDPLPRREFKLWAFKTDRSTDPQWDQPKALSRPLSTRPHSCWIEMFQTSTKLTIKFRKPSNTQTPSRSWDHQTWSGTKSLPKRAPLRIEISLRTEPALSDSHLWETKRRESSKWGEKTDGTPTSSLSPNTTSKSTLPQRSLSRELEFEK